MEPGVLQPTLVRSDIAKGGLQPNLIWFDIEVRGHNFVLISELGGRQVQIYVDEKAYETVR